MAVKPAIRSGETLTETEGGWQSTRVFDVTGLSGNAAAQLYRAAIRNAVPQIGETHPSVPGIVVTRRQATPLGADGVRVTCTYGQPSGDTPGQPAEVSLSADVIQDDTITDVNGDTIQTNYATASISAVQRVHRVDFERPSTTVAFRRLLSGVPKNQARDFVGKVNSREWSGFPAKTWLCRSISSSQDAPDRHRVTYEFTYKADTWQAEVSTDVDGLIPVDAEIGNGILRVDIYGGADFNALDVSF